MGETELSKINQDCNDRNFGKSPVEPLTEGFSDCNSKCSSCDQIRLSIADLSSANINIQFRAASNLRIMAKYSQENRAEIARCGGVNPLVTLISSTNQSIQEQSVTAILNISLCEETREPIAVAGAIHSLISALNTGTSVTKENAACCLLRLGETESIRSTIGRSGAIPPLVRLLESGSLRGKKDAATALYVLCSSTKDDKRRAVKAGIVRPLLDMISDVESEMINKALYVLAAVIAVTEAKGKVVEEEGIPVLVELVENGNRNQREIAVHLLLKICEASITYRKKVVEEGAVPALVWISSQSGSSGRKREVRSETNRLMKI